ncbi:MAG: EamA family transporter [Rhizobiaceae bacterium]|nr:EamA family transporter [Rhizobiaceae bacterium]
MNMRLDLVLLITVPVMLAFGQFLFKMAGRNISGNLGKDLWSIAFNPYFMAAGTLYVVASFLWVIALSRIDISKAYPFMASGFIIVPILGYFLLNETLSFNYFIGVSLIFIGIIVTYL